MRSIRILVSGFLLVAVCAAMSAATSAKATAPRREAPQATGVKVVKGSDKSGCKGPVWESNGNGAPLTNCPKGKMCCETLIPGSRGTIVEASTK
jgi:hypothetical protein